MTDTTESIIKRAMSRDKDDDVPVLEMDESSPNYPIMRLMRRELDQDSSGLSKKQRAMLGNDQIGNLTFRQLKQLYGYATKNKAVNEGALSETQTKNRDMMLEFLLSNLNEATIERLGGRRSLERFPYARLTNLYEEVKGIRREAHEGGKAMKPREGKPDTPPTKGSDAEALSGNEEALKRNVGQNMDETYYKKFQNTGEVPTRDSYYEMPSKDYVEPRAATPTPTPEDAAKWEDAMSDYVRQLAIEVETEIRTGKDVHDGSYNIMYHTVTEPSMFSESMPPWLRVGLLAKMVDNPVFIGRILNNPDDPDQEIDPNVLSGIRRMISKDAERIAYRLDPASSDKALLVTGRRPVNGTLNADAIKEADMLFNTANNFIGSMTAPEKEEKPIPEEPLVDLRTGTGELNYASDESDLPLYDKSREDRLREMMEAYPDFSDDDEDDLDIDVNDSDEIIPKVSGYENIDQLVDRYHRIKAQAERAGKLDEFLMNESPRFARMLARMRDISYKRFNGEMTERYTYWRAYDFARQMIEGGNWTPVLMYDPKDGMRVMKSVVAAVRGVNPNQISDEDAKIAWKDLVPNIKSIDALPKDARNLVLDVIAHMKGYDDEGIRARTEMYDLVHGDERRVAQILNAPFGKKYIPPREGDESAMKYRDAIGGMIKEASAVLKSLEATRGTMAGDPNARRDMREAIIEGRNFKDEGRRMYKPYWDEMRAIGFEGGVGKEDRRYVPGTNHEDFYVYLRDTADVPNAIPFQSDDPKLAHLNGIMMDPDRGRPIAKRYSQLTPDERNHMVYVSGDADADHVLRLILRKNFIKQKWKSPYESYRYDVTKDPEGNDLFSPDSEFVRSTPMATFDPEGTEDLMRRQRNLFTTRDKSKRRDLGSRWEYAAGKAPISVRMGDALKDYKTYDKKIQQIRNPTGYRGVLKDRLGETGYTNRDLAVLDDLTAFAYHMISAQGKLKGIGEDNKELADMEAKVRDDVRKYEFYARQMISGLKDEAEAAFMSGDDKRGEAIMANLDAFTEKYKRTPLAIKAMHGSMVHALMPYSEQFRDIDAFLEHAGDPRKDGTRGRLRTSKLTRDNIGQYNIPFDTPETVRVNREEGRIYDPSIEDKDLDRAVNESVMMHLLFARGNKGKYTSWSPTNGAPAEYVEGIRYDPADKEAIAGWYSKMDEIKAREDAAKKEERVRLAQEAAERQRQKEQAEIERSYRGAIRSAMQGDPHNLLNFAKLYPGYTPARILSQDDVDAMAGRYKEGLAGFPAISAEYPFDKKKADTVALEDSIIDEYMKPAPEATPKKGTPTGRGKAKNKKKEGDDSSMSDEPEKTESVAASMSMSALIKSTQERYEARRYREDDLYNDGRDRFTVFKNTAYPVHSGEGRDAVDLSEPKKITSEGTVRRI